MAEYFFLGKFDTTEGQVGLFERAVEVITTMDKLGVKVLNQWPTLGAFDVAVLVDAESELAIKKATLYAKQEFGINTTLLRCFGLEEAIDYVQTYRP